MDARVGLSGVISEAGGTVLKACHSSQELPLGIALLAMRFFIMRSSGSTVASPAECRRRLPWSVEDGDRAPWAGVVWYSAETDG